MTSKELLHRLVDDLGEPQAAEAITLLRARYVLPNPSDEFNELPEWVGAFSSGRSDLSERHEEILRDEDSQH